MQIDFMCAVVEDYIYRLKGVQVKIDRKAVASDGRQMAMLSMVLAKQEQLIGQYGLANPYVSPAQYRGTLGRMVEIAGFKDSAEFYKAITPEQDQMLSNPPPQEQQMPPEVQAIMARTQAEIQANQAKAMEKEQIIDALQEFSDITLPDEVCEKYYNETFKSE